MSSNQMKRQEWKKKLHTNKKQNRVSIQFLMFSL